MKKIFLLFLLFGLIIPVVEARSRLFLKSRPTEPYHISITTSYGWFVCIKNEYIDNEDLDLFTTAPSKSIGVKFPLYQLIHLKLTYGCMQFNHAIELGFGHMLAKEQKIQFNTVSLDAMLCMRYISLNLGINYYLVAEKINGIMPGEEGYFENKNLARQNTYGFHFGPTIQIPYRYKDFILEPNVNLNYCYIYGDFKGRYRDFYIRDAIMLSFGANVLF